MCHHAQPNARHAAFYRLDGRNRVLLARRNLPWPLACAYLLDWFALTVLRERSGMPAVRAWTSRVRGGLADGSRGSGGHVGTHRLADDPRGPPAGHLAEAGGYLPWSTRPQPVTCVPVRHRYRGSG